MAESVETLANEALQLPPDQRLTLAHKILSSVEPEEKEEGLGWRFRNEVLQVCQLIVQQPVLWRERSGG